MRKVMKFRQFIALLITSIMGSGTLLIVSPVSAQRTCTEAMQQEGRCGAQDMDLQELLGTDNSQNEPPATDMNQEITNDELDEIIDEIDSDPDTMTVKCIDTSIKGGREIQVNIDDLDKYQGDEYECEI
jgi:hypothetical protein